MGPRPSQRHPSSSASRRMVADSSAPKAWSRSAGDTQPDPGRRANSVRKAPTALSRSSAAFLAWGWEAGGGAGAKIAGPTRCGNLHSQARHRTSSSVLRLDIRSQQRQPLAIHPSEAHSPHLLQRHRPRRLAQAGISQDGLNGARQQLLYLGHRSRVCTCQLRLGGLPPAGGGACQRCEVLECKESPGWEV